MNERLKKGGSKQKSASEIQVQQFISIRYNLQILNLTLKFSFSFSPFSRPAVLREFSLEHWQSSPTLFATAPTPAFSAVLPTRRCFSDVVNGLWLGPEA